MSLSNDISVFKANVVTRIDNKVTLQSIKKSDVSSSYNDLANITLGLTPGGVTSGLAVSTGAGNVIIAPGAWKINHIYYQTTVITYLPYSVPDSSRNRYNVLYADSSNALNLAVGALSNTPAEPNIPAGTIKIASILITPSTVTVTPFEIDFVDNLSDQVIEGNKTFNQPIFVAAGTDNGHAVNLGQLPSLLAATLVPYTGANRDLNLGPHTITAIKGRFINPNVNEDGIIILAGGSTSNGVPLLIGDHNGNGIATFYNNIVNFYGLISFNSDGTLQAVINAGAANNFVVSNNGLLQYRTSAQVLADIGAAPAIVGGYVSSVTGTTNRITSSGGTTPVIDISASYAGQTSINTTGTITTGTWSGLFGAVSGANLTNITAANISAGTAAIDITGNAATVTNGVVTTGSYANPAWITAIPYSILSGTAPTWNQNTTGSAATLTTSRNIQGVAFNGSADINPINGTGFVKVTGTSLSYDNSVYLTTSVATSTYVPYSGSTANLDLGAHQLITTGNIVAAGIRLTTGAALNYVLQSDASGNASWVSITNSQTYIGTWNAATNTPALADGTGSAGSFYRVTTAGTTDFGHGGIAFSVGDDVQYNGTLWQRLPAPTIVGNALTKTDDTNVTLTLGGSASTALLNAASITVGWTGTLADGRIASAANWNTAYSNRIATFTTTGSSGAATFSGNTLNIPTYTIGGLGGLNLVGGTMAGNINMGGFNITAISQLSMSSILTLGSSGHLKFTNSLATFTGQFNAGAFTANRSYTIPDVDGTLATIDGGQTFTNATWAGGIIQSSKGGTSVNNSGSLTWTGGGGTLGTAAYTASSAYEVPLTFSTGLTRTTNTITVNYGSSSTTATVGNDSRVTNGQTAFTWGNWASNFGTATGTIAQGNDSRINNGQTAFTWNNWALNFGTATGTIAQGNDSRIINGQTAFTWGNYASASTHIGTTTISLNRASAAQTLTGVSIDGSAGSLNTAHLINGIGFDGTADINITAATPNLLTFNSIGSGAASGINFDGSVARTISYNTIGAPSLTGTGASGIWAISITGNAGTITSQANSATIAADTSPTNNTIVQRTSLGYVYGTYLNTPSGGSENNSTGLGYVAGFNGSDTYIRSYNSAALAAMLGLGSLATQSGTFSGTSTGTNTGDQTITLTGDITGSGTGSFATTYAGIVPSSKGGAGSINGILKANGSGAVSLAVANTDYLNASYTGFDSRYQLLENQRLSTSNSPTFVTGTFTGVLTVGTSADNTAVPVGINNFLYDDSRTSGVGLHTVNRQFYNGAMTTGSVQGFENFQRLAGGNKNISLGIISNTEWTGTTGTATDIRTFQSGIVASSTGTTVITATNNYISFGVASKNGVATGLTITDAYQFHATAFDTRGIAYVNKWSFYGDAGAGLLKILDGGIFGGTLISVNNYSTSATPSISLGSSGTTGTGATITIVGNNQDGIITLTTGTGISGRGDVFSIAMSGGFAYPIKCTPVLQNACTAGTDIFNLAIYGNNTVGWIATNVYTGGVQLSNSTVYAWTYHNGGY